MRTPGSNTCARCKTTLHLRPVALHKSTYSTGQNMILIAVRTTDQQVMGLIGMSPVAMQEASLTGICHAHGACAVVLIKVCVRLLLGRSCCGGLRTVRKGRRGRGWRSTGGLHLKARRSCASTAHGGLRRAGQAAQPSCAAHCAGDERSEEVKGACTSPQHLSRAQQYLGGLRTASASLQSHRLSVPARRWVARAHLQRLRLAQNAEVLKACYLHLAPLRSEACKAITDNFSGSGRLLK